MALAEDQLKAIVQGIDSDKWLVPLNDAMDKWAISSPQRMAAFLAQVAHESAGFTRLEEALRYTAKRLCQVWPKRFPNLKAAAPYANNPEKLANRVYAGRLGNGGEASGDGSRYRGRGLIQLTGRSNYASCSAATGIDLLQSPDQLLEPGAACMSAGWFWNSRGLNELADHHPGDSEEKDFARITVTINGAKTGFEQRVALWRKALTTLGA